MVTEMLFIIGRCSQRAAAVAVLSYHCLRQLSSSLRSLTHKYSTCAHQLVKPIMVVMKMLYALHRISFISASCPIAGHILYLMLCEVLRWNSQSQYLGTQQCGTPFLHCLGHIWGCHPHMQEGVGL